MRLEMLFVNFVDNSCHGERLGIFIHDKFFVVQSSTRDAMNGIIARRSNSQSRFVKFHILGDANSDLGDDDAAFSGLASIAMTLTSVLGKVNAAAKAIKGAAAVRNFEALSRDGA